MRERFTTQLAFGATEQLKSMSRSWQPASARRFHAARGPEGPAPAQARGQPMPQPKRIGGRLMAYLPQCPPERISKILVEGAVGRDCRRTFVTAFCVS